MPATALTRAFLLALGALSLGGCGLLGPAATPVGASDLPNPGLARLAGLTQLAFAWESRPTCKLETATGDALPETSWEPLPTNLLAGKTLDVAGMRVHKRDNTGPVQWLAIAVRDGTQVRWLRNAPTDDDAVAAQAWRCALGTAARDAVVKPVAQKRVRLAVGSAACTHFSPVLGGPEDLSILPYDVGEASVFAPPTLAAASAKSGDLGVFLGIRLKAAKGDGQLTVRSDNLAACFEDASDVPATALDEAQKLARWLNDEPPDPVDTPAVSSAVAARRDRRDDFRLRARQRRTRRALRVRHALAARGLRRRTARWAIRSEMVRERTVDAVHVLWRPAGPRHRGGGARRDRPHARDRGRPRGGADQGARGERPRSASGRSRGSLAGD